MPIPFLLSVYNQGWPGWLPPPLKLASGAGALAVTAAAKRYLSGTMNTSDRKLHGCVVMLTGGTSGIGAVVAYELAQRGASVVLLTAQPAGDPFVVDYVQELRDRTGNHLVYAEQVDLASLHSIRTFATKWIDTLPPRRLDMVVLCAATEARTDPASSGTPVGTTTADGIERAWMVNYLGNFHLLGLLSPALRSQPFDRDVRVIITTCASYIGAPPLVDTALLGTADAGDGKGDGDGKGKGTKEKGKNAKAMTKTGPALLLPVLWSPQRAYARSKLALMIFARSFQKHVDSYKRPDELPSNVRVLLVDPGLSRTPGLRRWVAGSGPHSLLWLVLGYVLFYPLWWFFVKSAEMGAQSILFAATEADLRRMRDLGSGGGSGVPGEPLSAVHAADQLADKLVKECRLMDVARRDVGDVAVAKALWEESDRLVEETEKRAAARRQAEQKAAAEEKAAAEKAAAEAAAKGEIEALVGAIKKGKEREKAKKSEKRKKDKAESETAEQKR